MNWYWLLLMAVLVPPKSYRVRLAIDTPASLSEDKARVYAALDRGLYLDSLIAKAPAGQTTPKVLPTDSAGWATMTRAAMIRGSMDEAGGLIELRVRLVDVLARTIAGPDTILVSRASLDSAVVERGRAYAKVLAKGR